MDEKKDFTNFRIYYLAHLTSAILFGMSFAMMIETKEYHFIALFFMSASATIVSGIYTLRNRFEKQ